MTIYFREVLVGRGISPGGLPGLISILTPSTVAARIRGLLVAARRVRGLLIGTIANRPGIVAEGVSPVKPGDTMVAQIDPIGEMSVSVRAHRAGG